MSAADEAAGVKKPALLKGGMVLCWLYAALLAIYLFMMPALPSNSSRDLLVTAPGVGTLNASALTGESARRSVIVLLVVSIAIAYGLAKDRHWSRWMMMGLLVLGVVTLPFTPELASGGMYAASIALAVFGWWYLYRKPNVVGYYEEIRRTRENAD